LSPLPTDAPLHCPHFGRCGGCSLLDVPIADQLQGKFRRARELLAPFLDAIDPTVTQPPRTPRHDRTSILYPARWQRGRLELGIYRAGTHEVEAISDCRIQHKTLTRLAVQATEVMRNLNLPAYDETTGRGLLRAFRARIMPGSNELLLGVVVTRADFSERVRLGKDLWAITRDLRDEQGRSSARVSSPTSTPPPATCCSAPRRNRCAVTSGRPTRSPACACGCRSPASTSRTATPTRSCSARRWPCSVT
jgi:tRNA/tmRNA/rRNA uracil-C5-methylase (TrmA/RlmC/RlmD family)